MRLFLLGLISTYNFLLGFIKSSLSVLWGLVGVAIGCWILNGCAHALQTTKDHESRFWIIGTMALIVLFFGLRFLHRVMRALPGFLPPGVRTYAPGDARFAKGKDLRRSGLLRRR